MSFSARFIAVCIFIWSASAIAGNRAAPAGTQNETYLFPTDASHSINSGFADYRDTHFHGGIDISTNGKIGYPVYASKSGYVYRVSVSPFGYGKRIVLRHDDSSFTLYGHLSAFSPEIEKRVEDARERDGKYDVDLTFKPGEIEVRRGEVIARTGATGVGGPHLHFEIHDRNYAFVDPLIYRSLDVPDYRTPRIFGVAAREYRTGKVQLTGVSGTSHVYRARSILRMNEPFFFVVHAADSYGRGRFKRPPKHMELSIDGKKYLSLDLTRIDADNYLDMSSLVDLKLSRGYKTYYRLCVDRAIPFPVFTPSAPLSGLVYGDFRNGMHTYEIIVGDENGNTASVTGRFVLNIRDEKDARDCTRDMLPVVGRFKETTLEPMPGLTLHFPEDAFSKEAHLVVTRISERSFMIRTDGERLRKRVSLTWKTGDPKLMLFRRERRGWEHVSCENDGKVLKARIGYEIGEFALIRDDSPPVVGRIAASKRNPFYRSVVPTQFDRYFVYFRVSDKLSGINTDDILLKVGAQKFLCEYDVDKHAAVCRVDSGLLRRERKVEVVVHDNAGNERVVESGLGFR